MFVKILNPPLDVNIYRIMRANLVAVVSLVIAILTVAGIGALSTFFQTTTVTVTETSRTTVTEKEFIPFTLTVYSISTVTETRATTIFNPTTITHTITSTETLPEKVTTTITSTDTIYRTVTSPTTLTQTVTKTMTTTTFVPTTVTSISPTTITSTATYFVTTTETQPTTYTLTRTTTQTITSPTTITQTVMTTITTPTTVTQTVTITSPTTITQTIISNVTQTVFQTITVTVFTYTTETGEQVVASVSNVNIPAYYYASFNVWVDAGKTVKLSWKADNNLYVYIMTESQFKSGWILLPSYYEAYKYGREGTISAYSCCGDKYYMVFINLNLATVKLYEAKVTVAQ